MLVLFERKCPLANPSPTDNSSCGLALPSRRCHNHPGFIYNTVLNRDSYNS